MPVEDAPDPIWRKRSGPVVFDTVRVEGILNAAHCEAVGWTGETADNDLEFTPRNILAGNEKDILFRTEDGKSYQAKGPIHDQTQGSIYYDSSEVAASAIRSQGGHRPDR